MDKKHLIILMLYSAAVVLSILFGWHLHSWYHDKYVHHAPLRIHAEGFRFTSPLLDVELPEGVGINDEPMPFKHKVEEYVKTQISGKQATEVSVYYRDLLDGPWFGVDDNKEFNPASMLKVPVMVAWLKRAEKNPQLLKRVMTNHYTDDMRVAQNIKPAHSAELGHSYSVEELLHLMMNYSDNNATRLLYDQISTEEINNVMRGMGVDTQKNSANSLTGHGYSGFFRILYNASYLNREMSEKALQLLSLEDFPQGIISGIPKGTVVASKFGESTEGPSDEIKLLHEFGIVYHAKHPYILGIMTKGNDFGQLAHVIQGVSRLVYSEVDTGFNIDGRNKH